MDERTRTVLITGIVALILVAVVGYIVLRPEKETATPQPTAPSDTGEGPSGEPAPIWLTENITLHPVADATLDSYHPDANYGSGQCLNAGDHGSIDSSWTDWSYIRFNILENIPEGASIKSAKLRLYSYAVYGEGAYNFKICRVLGEWSEGGITWGNKPDVDSANPYYQSTREAPPTGQYVEYDVKQYVEDVLRDGWDYGLALTADTDGDSADDYINFQSKEWDHIPELVITYEYQATMSWQEVLLTYGPWLALGAGLLAFNSPDGIRDLHVLIFCARREAFNSPDGIHGTRWLVKVELPRGLSIPLMGFLVAAHGLDGNLLLFQFP